MTIKYVQADITQLDVDAIVNAANPGLLGGGGVDGAIHKAAGSELLAACKKLDGCKIGHAKITPGFLLKSRYVIHTVGPIYKTLPPETADELLRSAYRECLKLSEANHIQTIAFPNISTGVYGFPKPRAAQIAIKTVKEFEQSNPKYLQQIIFCCYDDENFNIYKKFLNN